MTTSGLCMTEEVQRLGSRPERAVYIRSLLVRRVHFIVFGILGHMLFSDQQQAQYVDVLLLLQDIGHLNGMGSVVLFIIFKG